MLPCVYNDSLSTYFATVHIVGAISFVVLAASLYIVIFHSTKAMTKYKWLLTTNCIVYASLYFKSLAKVQKYRPNISGTSELVWTSHCFAYVFKISQNRFSGWKLQARILHLESSFEEKLIEPSRLPLWSVNNKYHDSRTYSVEIQYNVGSGGAPP